MNNKGGADAADIGKKNEVVEKKLKGIIAYPQIHVVEVYKTSLLTNKEKQITGEEGKDCRSAISYTFSKRVDYTKPFILRYKSGWLESNKFSVTMADGAVTNINSESTPANVFGKIPDYLPYKFPTKDAELEFGLADDKKPLVECNAGKVLKGVYKMDKFESFEPDITMQK
jgi:hypothetical protein